MQASKAAAAAAIGIAIVLVIVAYGGALSGAFVFDDTKQIAANPYIQDPRNLATALTSDVWAFEGSADAPSSAYWRPVFIAWLAAGWALFGAAPEPWHVASLVLHCIAACLAYFVLRSARAGPAAAAIACWIFAVHPVHVESVAWVSGSPDLLLAIFLFAAFLAHREARRRASRALEGAALAMYALALLCKELAVVFPLMLAFSDRAIERDARPPWSKALRGALPYAALAAAYLLARVAVLGTQAMTVAGAPDGVSAVLSAPAALMFYLREIVWPFELAPSHAFTPVTPATLSATNFLLPLVAVALLAAGWVRLARARATFAVALAWFVLPLLPPLDLRHFIPEDLVHDRYLYVPLFGMAMLAAEGIAWGWDSAAPARSRGGMRAAWAVGLPLALALAAATRAYVPTWHDEIALWERAARMNPSVAYPHGQLGEAYRKAGRLPEARAELTRALALNPGLKNAHSALGALAHTEGKLDEAAQHLQLVLDARPNDRGALEQMALVQQKLGRYDDAIVLFERGRRNLPARWEIYTVNLGVLHRMAGRIDEAESTLRSLGTRLETSKDPNVLRAWWFLGELDRERGRSESAIASYAAYIAATAGIADASAARLRESAGARIRELGAGIRAP